MQLASVAGAIDWPVRGVVADGEGVVEAWVKAERITIPVISDKGGSLAPAQYDPLKLQYRRLAMTFGPDVFKIVSDSEEPIEQIHALWVALKKGTD